MHHDFEHLPHELRWCSVSTLRRAFAAVEHHQHRQGPRATGERKLNQHREHDPLVAVAECRVGMRRSHGIAMPVFAKDFLAAMFVYRFVADQTNYSVGNEVPDDPVRQRATEPPRRPWRAREDAMIARRMADVQGRDGPQ